MLAILSKLFGPNRAVSIYVSLKRFGIPVALFAGFGLIFWIVVALSHPDRMEHMAYHTLEVVAVTPLTQDPNAGVFVDIRLPDGEVVKLTETEGAISRALTDTACVQQWRDRSTGEVSWRLRRPIRCAE